MNIKTTLLFLFFCSFSFLVKSQAIHIAVGTGTSGFGGDENQAIYANINAPEGVAIDASGNIYIADKANQRIRKITTDGNIHTIAGTGTAGFLGDGGLATFANLYNPTAVAVDINGNVYVADNGNNRIRKITKDGIISTVAGNGIAGYNGDGILAINAQLNLPQGIFIDASGNLFIADKANNRVREITIDGKIKTIAGNGLGGYSGDGGLASQSQLFNPYSLAIDANGNIFIADTYNQRIRKITLDGKINTYAGTGLAGEYGYGGLAIKAELNFPQGICIDNIGNLYIADNKNNGVVVVGTNGIITKFSGTDWPTFGGDGGKANSAQLFSPYAVASDGANNIFIADNGNNRIRKVTTDGIINTIAGTSTPNYSGDGGLAKSANIYYPLGVAADASGNIFIPDLGNNRIRMVSVSTGIITTIAGNGIAASSGDGGAAITAQVYKPQSIAVDATGNLYFNEYANNKIRKITTDGNINTATTGFNTINIAVDRDGNIYSANGTDNTLIKIAKNGTNSIIAGSSTDTGFNGDGSLATLAKTNGIWCVAVDGNGNIYFSDYNNYRIRKISPDGTINTIAGTGISGLDGDGGQATSATIKDVRSIALDATGNIFLCDFNGQKVRKISTNGIITTVARNGNNGYGLNVEGMLADSTRLSYPSSITTDASGNLYIANLTSNNILKVCFSGSLSTNAISVTTTQNTVGTTQYAGSSICNSLVALLKSTGTNPVNGSVTAKTWVESPQPIYFVARHYEITPTTNPTTATGTITLFFTQADFDGFNNQSVAPASKLPTGPTDAVGISHLLVQKEGGVSNVGTGLPGTYPGVVTTINPDDANIVWNTALQCWEVSFDVTGFSGFFIKTQSNPVVLPLTLLNFTASRQGNNNVLNWTTSNEVGTKNFVVESSANGSSFTPIGTVSATGGGNYNYLDINPIASRTYYRLKMVDADSKFTYSNIVWVNSLANASISLYPNPVAQSTTLNIGNNTGLIGTKAQLTDVGGRLLQQITINHNQQQVNMTALPAGLYLLKLNDGTVVKIMKQ